MKKIFTASLMFAALYSQGQTENPDPKPISPWQNDLQVGINLNQSSFSDNWKAGGVNSSAATGFLNAKANYKKEKTTFENDLQLQYGNTRLQGEGLQKNADRIFLNSKFGHDISKHWNLFASANFISQFDAGFEYFDTGSFAQRRISGFLSPAYLTEALGLEYKPASYFSTQFGLIGLRQTIVLDQELYDKYSPTEEKYNLLYGVQRGEKVRNQFVGQLVVNFDKEIMKNLFLKLRYQGVIDYERINHTGIVSRFDGSIVAKVNRFITVNFTAAVLYDYDQDEDIQYSQVMSIGILYRLTNMKE
jgi:hypothetical protein